MLSLLVMDKHAPKHAAEELSSPRWWSKLYASIWLFPLVLTAVLLLLTLFKINGSSLGTYHTIFNGHTQNDALLFSKPREIRADEWIVNTQMVIAQKNNDYARVNENIGKGQDMSVVLDVPYKEWSQAFRPQNLSFFVMPFDFAFAFKWWLMAYLLVLSCYFFVLALLPGRRLVAAALSVALLFGAMIQWWYQFITLAPVYYSLFLATATIHLVRARRLLHTVLWGGLIAYLTACFALVLYPPFQIACGLGLAAFLGGYLLQGFRGKPRGEILRGLGVLGAALVIAGAVVLLFVQTRSGVIHTIANTAYPGQRVVESGGFDAAHIFSGHLGFMFQAMSKAQHYQINDGIFINQSEASNFILLLPFLLLPSIYLVFQDRRRQRRTDWPLITVNLAAVFLAAWMLIPNLDILGKPFLLDKVQLIRLLLGLGLLNLFQLVLLIRRLPDLTGRCSGKWYVAGYALVVLGVQFLLGLIAMDRAPGFIVLYQVIILALPVPVIVYLLLRKHVTLAVLGLLGFSVFTTCLVNPLYRGTEVLTKAPLVQAIREVNAREPGTWTTETIYLENFPALSGVPSRSGVYAYPQLDLWRSADSGGQEEIYNRYAHVGFEFDRNPAVTVPTSLKLTLADHFDITTEPCGPYVHQEKIRYILAVKPMSDSCLEVVKTVKYPLETFIIYKVK